MNKQELLRKRNDAIRTVTITKNRNKKLIINIRG